MPRKTKEYTSEHARGGVHAELPEIETWDNQYHGYEITITIEKATFNEPIAPEKFDLKRPEGAELIDLSAAKQGENPVGK